jgi:hypothetical protein
MTANKIKSYSLTTNEGKVVEYCRTYYHAVKRVRELRKIYLQQLKINSLK